MIAAELPGFTRFWAIWPRNSGRYSRKGAKAACLKVWTKNYNETQADLICQHVAWLTHTEAWLQQNGAYIPAPLVYLNQQRWDGAEIPESAEPTPETTDVQQSKQWMAQQQMQHQVCIKGDEVKARIRAIKERLKA